MWINPADSALQAYLMAGTLNYMSRALPTRECPLPTMLDSAHSIPFVQGPMACKMMQAITPALMFTKDMIRLRRDAPLSETWPAPARATTCFPHRCRGICPTRSTSSSIACKSCICNFKNRLENAFFIKTVGTKPNCQPGETNETLGTPMPHDLRRSVPLSDPFYIAGLDDSSEDVATPACEGCAPELAVIHDGEAALGGPALPNRCASLALASFPRARCRCAGSALWGVCRTAAGLVPWRCSR